MNETDRNILESLRHVLDSDRFSSQSRLPPERELAVELGISRFALRKALAILEEEGRIWRHVGRGTFVGLRPEPSEEEMPSVISATNPTEIMEARLILEPNLAALAALRATMSEFSKMELFLDRSKEAINTADFQHWDGLLHQTIAKATDNSLLISIFMVIHNVRASNIWGRLKEASDTVERREIYYCQHHDLVEALKDRDPVRAERIMREHLETLREHLLEIHEPQRL